jgi:hypothetical protein
MSWFTTLLIKDESITIDSRLYDEDYMFKHWNEDNPDYDFTPRTDRTHLLPIDRQSPLYFVARKGERIVGYAGLIDDGSHYKGAGVRVHPEFRRGGTFGRLVDIRNNKIGSKPAIIFMNTQTMSIETFASKWERYGWETRDYDVSKVNNPDLKKVAQQYLDAYGNFMVLND